MSTSEYAVKLVLQQGQFFPFLQFLQANRAGEQYIFHLTSGQTELQLGSASEYFVFLGQEYHLHQQDVRLQINFPLPQSWFSTFDLTVSLQLPADSAYKRYLADTASTGQYAADESVPVGNVLVRARGLEHLHPGFVEVELLPLIAHQYLLESMSWRRWLIQLAENTQAFLLYTVVDFTTYTILWHRGQEVRPLSISDFDDLPDARSALRAAQALVDTVRG